MPAKDFIAAIELGSSQLRGIAGRKNSDGNLSVYAYASEDSSTYIKKGIVHNLEKTIQGITNIVNKLKTSLGREISQVYVGVSGQSIISVKNEIVRDLQSDTLITQQMVNELMDVNRNKTYADKQILDVAIQEYKVGNDYENDPAGIQADQLTGNFLNILWRKKFYDKLTNCFERAGVNIVELYIAPLALADCLLDDTAKRAGCILVDLGADTTTMMVYYKNILRHIAVIPLGSNNITKDITSLNIDMNEAEKMKKKYGCAYTETQDMDKTLEYPVGINQSVQSVKFQQVVEARMKEIIVNVYAQVPSEYKDKINGGIVLTGGGSNLKNIVKAFRQTFSNDKISVVPFIHENVNATSRSITIAHDGTMNTILGLLMKGDQSCDGGEMKTGLFNDDEEKEEPAIQRNPTDDKKYIAGSNQGVRTPAEIAAAAELARKQDNEEWAKAEADNTEEAYQSYKEKYPAGLHTEEAAQKIEALQNKKKKTKERRWGGIWDRFKNLVTEEEE